MSSSYTLISTQYCTANLELSASKKFSQKSQEPRCCKYFSLWINWFSNASDISFPDSLHLDRENKLLQTSLYPVNCEQKVLMNKSCFTVLYACYKCLQDSWPISFAHGGGPDIYCQRSLFQFYEKKERMVLLLVEITCIYCIKQLTSCKAVKKREYNFKLAGELLHN